MASFCVALLCLCLWLVPNEVRCQDQVERTAEIVIVLSRDSGRPYLPRVGLHANCSHHLDCADFYAICSNLTRTCVCPRSRGYRSNGNVCVFIGDTSDSVAIYKVTLVVAAVFMVVVFVFFVGCVIKRTCERAREYNERMRELNTDVYTVPVEFEGMEKPPSYTEIVKIDHMLYGVPPPDYATVTSTGPPTSQAVLPPRTQPLSAFRQSSGPSSGPVLLLPLRTSATASGSGTQGASVQAAETCRDVQS